MKKYIIAILIFTICFFTLGCGELTFDDIIYTDVTETVELETLTEAYDTAMYDTVQLNVRYETVLEVKINDNEYVREVVTSIGEHNRKTIFQVEIACKTGTSLTKTIRQTCYDGEIFTAVEMPDGNVTKSYATYDTNTYTKETFVEAILPKFNPEHVEAWYQKTFEGATFTKYAVIWNKINPEFTEVADEEALINMFDQNLMLCPTESSLGVTYNNFGYDGLNYTLPSTYITNYYVEYGIKPSSGQYFTMLRKEYQLLNQDDETYGSVKSTTLLTNYGQEVKDIVPPEDVDTYKNPPAETPVDPPADPPANPPVQE